MKRAFRILPMAFLIVVFLLSAISCQGLKVDSLKANEHFKKANKFYTEEKYKRAIAEYKEALAFNPQLTQIYKYMGTAQAALFRPGDDSEENKAFGDEAQTNLKKAQELEPDDPKIVIALGQLSDKMRDFEEAERQFLKVLEKNPQNPDIYIILADFYKSYPGKEDKVLEMYDKRISINPDDPDNFLFPAKYYFDRQKWDDALRFHELRMQKIEQSTKYDEKEKQLKLADAYYRIGHLCWARSYQTQAEMMAPAERQGIIDKGMENLTKAIVVSPIFPDPYVYKGLLYLELDKIDPVKHDEHQAQRDALVKKYQELMKDKQKREQDMRELQRES